MIRAPRRLLLCALLPLAAAGCMTHLFRPEPDLGRLYDRSATSQGPERNPVIVIPGIAGSRLVQAENGRMVWGAFTGDYARPDRPEDARLIALPMEEGVPLTELRDDVHPAGVLDRVRIRLLGLPIRLQAYFHILAALGVGGYRDESLGLSGEVDYGGQHFTCFQFDYDWRRDNVENAKRLHRFIQEKAAYVRTETERRFGSAPETVKFDIVAHSMGGLLLRYYLRYGDADLPADGSLPELTWAGAPQVERAILVATPNAGTLHAFEQLVEGKDYGPFVSPYPAALLGTFPSGYQVMPRPRHRPVARADDPSRSIGDIFDPRLWEEHSWGLLSPESVDLLSWLLPGEKSPEARRRIALDHIVKSLERARRFTAALDRPATPPAGLRYYLIASDSEPTPRLATFRAGRGYTVLETGPGDGTVLRSSALMDEREGGPWEARLVSPITWHTVVFLFNDHLGLTKDPMFTDNLLYWLLEEPWPDSAGRGRRGAMPSGALNPARVSSRKIPVAF